MAASIKDIKAKMKGYRQPDDAARDVHGLIQHYKDLKIGAEQYVYPEGRREQLFRLQGTIPVTYRGATYNIPLVIWLQKTHPQHNPIPYVTPTAEMSINPSRYVDTSGRIYLPYITEWRKGQSDLSTLVQILCATFAENIPVFKKQQQQTQSYAPPGGYRHPQPSFPQPYGGGGGGGYPPTGTPYSRPPPSHPPYGGPPQPSYSSSTPYPSGGASMPMPGGGYNPNPPYPRGSPGGFQPPYPAGGVATAYGQQSVPQMSVEEERRKIEEDRRRAEEEERQRKEAERKSLESAVEDKIKRQLISVLERAKDEMQMLEKTQRTLKENRDKLNSSLTDMDTKQAKIESNIEMLKVKTAELNSVIDQLESQPDTVNPDDAVCASNAVHNQILNLYAEETAIEDALYYLGEALRKEVITHEVFLKMVRDLSRKQFMIRATIMKARDTAKLPPHGIPS